MDLAPVSVVIPAYNSEEFIGEAISSVLAQTLKVAEIIVVDDGSSDRTAEVAAKMGALVIRQAHGGISAARNAGIRAAKYEWIAFLDADDIWETTKIGHQWAAIQRYPDVGLVSCDLSQWRHGPDIAGSVYALAGEVEARMVYVPEACGDFLIDQMRYNSPTMLIRRDLLLSVGLFDERVRYVEGVECYLRVMAHCPIVLVELPLVRQRLHDRNTSRNSTEMRLSWIRMIDQLAAAPDRYPPGAAATLERDVFGQLMPLGRELLDQGRGREARDLFRRRLKKKFSTRAMMLWTLSFLDFAKFDRLLIIKRKLNIHAS